MRREKGERGERRMEGGGWREESGERGVERNSLFSIGLVCTIGRCAIML